MMLNLFSVFDPSTKFFMFNWFSIMLLMFLLPQIFWLINSRFLMLFFNFLKLIMLEFKILMMNYFNFINILYFMVLFLFIMINNFLGLFPYIFTGSSHLLFSLMFSFSMWLSLMLFGWLKNTKFMFIHLVPLGTPFVLMFFMVLIETLSNLIRPLTLCIRLTANMIAGHLLLTLLGLFIYELIYFYLLILLMQILLMMLELFVSFIQSYVFVVLMILYLKETN